MVKNEVIVILLEYNELKAMRDRVNDEEGVDFEYHSNQNPEERRDAILSESGRFGSRFQL